MKIYTAKTVDEALEQAAQEQGVAVNELIYAVSDKKKGLFNKKLMIAKLKNPNTVAKKPSPERKKEINL